MLFKQIHNDPDVFLIRVPAPGIAPITTNCFVVKAGADALVIDTGAPTEEGYAVLSLALCELGIDSKRTSFFLTHFHFDHAGLVDRIAGDEARLYVSAVDFGATLAPPDVVFAQSMRRLTDEGVSAGDAKRYVKSVLGLIAFDPRRHLMELVADGDVIPVGRYRFRVVGTPGHTPGHLSLYEPVSRILFGGDHVLYGISPCIAAFPDGGDGLQAYLDSLKKVRSLECRKLFFSHGRLRDDFAKRIEWLINHHLERLSETVGIVEEKPGSCGEEVIKSLRWNVPFASWEDIPTAQQWCILTEGTALLNHLVKIGRIARTLDAAGIFRYERAGLAPTLL